VAIADRRAGVGFAVALVVCVVLVAPGSGGGSVSEAATRCSNLTVDGGRFVGELTLRVVLLGRVSCAKAHRVVRAYYRKIKAGRCSEGGNFCLLSFPGGWSCSIFSYGVSQTAGGAMAGCAKARSGARIRLYKARPTSHLKQFLSPDRQVWCVVGRTTFCAAGPPPGPGAAQPPQYGATLERDGTVTTCAVPTPGEAATCSQNWNPGARVLPLGRRNRRAGVLCRAAPTGITCKLAGGPAKGKGFTISATSVAELGAAKARAAATARGTILAGVFRQTVSQTDSQGNVTNCDVIGGILRTDRGETVTFAAGGVLAPDLAPQEQAIVDTIEQGARQGSQVVATITYVDSRTLCGYPLARFVTSASLTPAPPAPPAPPPPPPLQPPPPPAPVEQTATGTITRMSPLGFLVGPATDGGPFPYCRVWPGRMKTDDGRTIDFSVATGLTGSLAGAGLKLADPAAFDRFRALHEAAGLGRRAVARITYIGPVSPCGRPLEAVVTAADVKVPQTKRTLRGRIQRILSPDVISADGSKCRTWTGWLINKAGKRIAFHLETVVSGFSLRPPDPRARRIAKRLRKAQRTQARTTLTTSGPVYACGRVLSSVVTRASVRKRA
jgi:hypothetical protein